LSRIALACFLLGRKGVRSFIISAMPASRNRPSSRLAIDDKSLVLQILVDMLEELGHSVKAVASDTAALVLLESGQHFDAIVTDISMPKMSGIHLIRRVRQSNADLPVLFLSAYTSDSVGLEELLDVHTKFLAKPYSIEALDAKLGCVLH
jgi:CheY-like chemotaxis protein